MKRKKERKNELKARYRCICGSLSWTRIFSVSEIKSRNSKCYGVSTVRLLQKKTMQLFIRLLQTGANRIAFLTTSCDFLNAALETDSGKAARTKTCYVMFKFLENYVTLKLKLHSSIGWNRRLWFTLSGLQRVVTSVVGGTIGNSTHNYTLTKKRCQENALSSLQFISNGKGHTNLMADTIHSTEF